jgi:myo-inositol 2-dehydrogenase / D-chiro-inositol 1-dehydrogenase
MKVKVGVIGAGHMGQVHARILAKDARVQLVGIADISAKAGSLLAEEVGTKSFLSLEALLDEGIEALYVTTPNSTHLKPVITALERNIHVFSEKPMATSLAEAEQILEASKKSKGIYQIGFNYRFAPVHKLAKEFIDAGTLKPYHVHIKDNRGELIDPPWVGNIKITGGYLYESTIHTMDLLMYLLGDIKSVRCLCRTHLYQEMDDFALLFSFKNGSMATLDSCAHASWLFPAGALEIYGDHATLLTEEMEKVRYTLGLGQPIQTLDYFQMPQPAKWGYVEEDKLFIDAILNGTPSAVPAEEAFRVIKLIDDIYHQKYS